MENGSLIRFEGNHLTLRLRQVAPAHGGNLSEPQLPDNRAFEAKPPSTAEARQKGIRNIIHDAW